MVNVYGVERILLKMNDKEEKKKVLKPIYTNKALALSLAVAMTFSITLSGCGNRQIEDEEEDDSYYYGGSGYHGGVGYFYASGSSYRSGSWSDNAKISSAKSGYSSTRGGSIGG